MDKSSESVEKPVKRKLRWYQFSLRTLLIVVTLFAVACSWFAVKMNRTKARSQREAIEVIRNLGGSITYDYISEVGNSSSTPMRGLLGEDASGNVAHIGVLISYLPTERVPSLGLVFLAGFIWLLLTSYVYPFLVLGWIVLCRKPMRKRFIVLIAEVILIFVQTAVVIALH